MKTPDDIKKGMECHFEVDGVCEECPYNDELDCTRLVYMDVLAYIQQQEMENTRRHEKIIQRTGGRSMSKIVCPECGGRLTFETLCQYGIQRKVKPDGTLCKQTQKRDYGSMEHNYLFCEACKWTAEEEEFVTNQNKVDFWEEAEE